MPSLGPPGTPKSSLFARLRDGLSRTRENLATGLAQVFRQRERISPETLDDLEAALLAADMGPAVAERLVRRVRAVEKGEGSAMDRAITAVRDEIVAILEGRGEAASPVPAQAEPVPGRTRVVLVIGVNGTGKTTTVAKLARIHRSEGRSVLLGAADTFRAAAIEQLALWAERAGVEIVRQRQGADPAAVAFDAAEAALARGADVLLVDTAGRLHTREDLRGELAKIARVLDKKIPGAPHETLLVLDGSTGQTALAQAALFQQTVPITGLVVTKLDGTARAGVVVAVRERFGIPVRWVGVGEGLDDLQPFDARQFADALLDAGA